MKDAIIVGGGLAGLSAAWRLRNWDIELLEADHRVGGRVRSERRGDYWLNWGGHVFAGPESATGQLQRDVGIEAVPIPGNLQAMSMNGRLLLTGHLATYPLRLPMDAASRAATFRVGATKLMPALLQYIRVVAQRRGESGTARQQRIYDFMNEQSFADFIGDLPEDARALFATTVTRSAGTMDEISAGAGVGYFSLVLGFGQGLNYGFPGGPSTLTESIATGLGDRLKLNAAVTEVVQLDDRVRVTYEHDGREHTEEARTVVMATTADITHRITQNLRPELHRALGMVKYGPHVSTAFLTNEQGPRPWDDIYAISCPHRSFAIALNQANLVRGMETERKPGGSMMTFSPADLGRQLLDKSDEEVAQIHLRDLDEVLEGRIAGDVVEAQSWRIPVASPYSFPGRAKIQADLVRGDRRVYVAGDFMGTLYTESAVTSGFSAAQSAASRLGTDRVLASASTR